MFLHHFACVLQYIVRCLGNAADAYQNCPDSFFGEYTYEATDAQGATSCGTGREHWDVCTDYTRMTFDYTLCNTVIASSGMFNYIMIINLYFEKPQNTTYFLLYLPLFLVFQPKDGSVACSNSPLVPTPSSPCTMKMWQLRLRMTVSRVL